jgi:hypothetical protein
MTPGVSEWAAQCPSSIAVARGGRELNQVHRLLLGPMAKYLSREFLEKGPWVSARRKSKFSARKCGGVVEPKLMTNPIRAPHPPGGAPDPRWPRTASVLLERRQQAERGAAHSNATERSTRG